MSKDIVGFPDYKVFEDGSIVSYRRYKAGQLLKQVPNDKGQVYVRLYKTNGDPTPLKKASRLVAEAYLPNPYNLPDVVHKNSDKADNRVENLEWSNHQDTHWTAQRNGRYKQYKIDEKKGEKIRELSARGIGDSELARRFKVNRITIRRWRLGKNYKAAPKEQQEETSNE